MDVDYAKISGVEKVLGVEKIFLVRGNKLLG